MSNSEYEETVQEVNELSNQNDNPELLEIIKPTHI